MNAPLPHSGPHADPRIDVQQWWRWRCTPGSGWPSRAQALEALEALMDVVPWGTGTQLRERYDPQTPCVQYLDDMAHAGDGKIMTRLSEVAGGLASVYLGPPGISLRLLRIGNRHFWLRYRAPGQWASNQGDEGDICAVECPDQLIPDWSAALHAEIGPIWAVDFVCADPTPQWAEWSEAQWHEQWPRQRLAELNLRACDLNLAPGIQGTGLHQTLGGSVTEALLSAARQGDCWQWSAPEWTRTNAASSPGKEHDTPTQTDVAPD